MPATIDTDQAPRPLMNRLCRRTLTLHGIHIGLAGCGLTPSKMAPVDIDLKGVRVSAADGLRQEFDVYLGGGTDGAGEASRPYKLGVDLEQLPQLVEDVIREYYLRHTPGESFSGYWRQRLSAGGETKSP
jgi:sulfite reductase beta subunit-like hemoprotein